MKSILFTAIAILLAILTPAIYSPEPNAGQSTSTPVSRSTAAASKDADSDTSSTRFAEDGTDWPSDYLLEVENNQRRFRFATDLITAVFVTCVIVVGFTFLGFLGLTRRKQRRVSQLWQSASQENLQMWKEVQQNSQESLVLIKERVQLDREMRDLLREIANAAHLRANRGNE